MKIYNTPLPLKLTFLVGLDTLEHLFSPWYYASEVDMIAFLCQFLSPASKGENSCIICAKRVSPPAEAVQYTEDFMSFAPVKEFKDSDQIVTIDIGDVVSSYSSSAIRNAIGRFNLEHGAIDLHQDGGWKNMVTRDIADYIVEHRLYVD